MAPNRQAPRQIEKTVTDRHPIAPTKPLPPLILHPENLYKYVKYVQFAIAPPTKFDRANEKKGVTI